MNERWLPVVGAEGRYEISDHGRCRNAKTGRTLKPNMGAQGYNRYNLPRPITVHTLVLTAFTGPRPEGLCSRHLDGNPLNNHISNLRWGTYVENAADRERHGRTARGRRQSQTKLTTGAVDEIRRRAQTGETRTSIAAAFGVSRPHVNNILNGKKWAWYTAQEGTP